MAAAALPVASAHTTEADHGDFEIVYEDAEGDCDDVLLVGSHVDTAHGFYTLWAGGEGSAPGEKVAEGEFNGTPEEEGEGFAIRIGPFNLPEIGDSDGYDFALTWNDTEAHELHFAFDARCEDAQSPPPCTEEGVTATANGDGTITLAWTQEAPVVQILRDGVHYATVVTSEDATSRQYNDVGTEPGETYSYELRFMDGNEDVGSACVEVTAIPFFGAPVLAALAVAGCVGAFVMLRRR